MRRAIALIVVLTVMCLGLGLWLDLTQRHTAREYLDGKSNSFIQFILSSI